MKWYDAVFLVCGAFTVGVILGSGICGPTEVPVPPRETSPAHQLRDSLVIREATAAGISPTLALAIAHVENPWADPTIVSHAGAVGLMQVLPPQRMRTEREREQRAELIRVLCGTLPLTNPECNVRVGIAIYSGYLTRYGDERIALAAYNGALGFAVSAKRYVDDVRRARARYVETL